MIGLDSKAKKLTRNLPQDSEIRHELEFHIIGGRADSYFYMKNLKKHLNPETDESDKEFSAKNSARHYATIDVLLRNYKRVKLGSSFEISLKS